MTHIKYLAIVLATFSLTGCVAASSLASPPPPITPPAKRSSKNCLNDDATQTARSKELQDIVEKDQAPRMQSNEKTDWVKVSREDEARIKRVAEIFAEGCLKSAKDYAAAALVFQHGSVPDHYYQTYIWSKRAVELGDENQKQMIANSVDRYLINRGFKQIFAAQTFRAPPDLCRCLEQTHVEFPDNIRKIYTNKSLAERVAETVASNATNSKCGKITYCEKPLKTPPKGMFPGIW